MKKREIPISTDADLTMSGLIATLATELFGHRSVSEGVKLRLRALAERVGAPVPAME